MPPRKSYFISPDVIATDREALVALQQLPNYTPVIPDFDVDVLNALDEQLRRDEEAVVVAKQALAQARNARDNTRWQFHQRMLGVKALVRALFGPNSDAIRALGMKRTNDYQRPTRRAKNDE